MKLHKYLQSSDNVPLLHVQESKRNWKQTMRVTKVRTSGRGVIADHLAEAVENKVENKVATENTEKEEVEEEGCVSTASKCIQTAQVDSGWPIREAGELIEGQRTLLTLWPFRTSPCLLRGVTGRRILSTGSALQCKSPLRVREGLCSNVHRDACNQVHRGIDRPGENRAREREKERKMDRAATTATRTAFQPFRV